MAQDNSSSSVAQRRQKVGHPCENEDMAALGMERRDTKWINRYLAGEYQENPESRILNLRESMDDTINQG